MKKYKLLFVFAIIILLCACEKTKDVTPSLTQTPAKELTPTALPTVITPVPTQAVADTSDFFEIMRLLPPGTVVETKDMSEADIKRCFYIEEISAELTAELKKAGFPIEDGGEKVFKLRALYKTGERCIIGELYTSGNQAGVILDYFYDLYNDASATHGGYPVRDEFVYEAQLKWSPWQKYVYMNNRYYYYVDIWRK